MRGLCSASPAPKIDMKRLKPTQQVPAKGDLLINKYSKQEVVILEVRADGYKGERTYDLQSVLIGRHWQFTYELKPREVALSHSGEVRG